MKNLIGSLVFLLLSIFISAALAGCHSVPTNLDSDDDQDIHKQVYSLCRTEALTQETTYKTCMEAWNQ